MFTELKRKNNGYVLMTKNKDGYEITVKSQYDESPDTSFIGTFSDKPGVGAIKQNKGANSYTYFNPANPEHAAEEYERIQGLERGDWEFTGVIAIASLCGVKLGTDAVWGVESDCGEEYLLQVCNDMAASALAIAKEKYAELTQLKK